MGTTTETTTALTVPQTPELQKAAVDIAWAHQTAQRVAKDAPKVPSAFLTGMYREYGMIKTLVYKPSIRSLTAGQALGRLTGLRDRVQKTDFSRLSAADHAKLPAAVAAVLELIDAALPAKAAA